MVASARCFRSLEPSVGEASLSPAPMLRRNNSLIRGANVPVLGVRAWGDIIMTDSESWKERRNQVARYRAMEQETTDPLAARLLHDIVLELEAELEGLSNDFSPS
jgi:hypothetical protein